MEVSIVIPNYNGEKLLQRNLPKVFDARDNLKKKILEIIVVDDGPNNGRAALVKDKFTQVVSIRQK